MVRWIGAVILVLVSSPALAQLNQCPNTTPGFTAGGSVFGRLSTQWNQYFGAKVDAVNGVLCNPTIIGLQLPTVPDADLLGGSSNTFTSVSVGANLQLSSGVLSAVNGGSAIYQLTGDVLAGPGVGSQAATLAASGVSAGTYTKITVDNKGRATVGATAACSDLSDSDSGCSSAAGITQLTGDATAGPGSGSQALTLATTGVVAGSYSLASITVDGKGRVTSASNGVSKQRLAIGWPSGIDPVGNIIATIDEASTVLSIVGSVTTPVGAAANVDVYKAGSGVACGSGTKLNNATPFNANGSANTNQTLTLASTTISAGDRICLVTDNSANWTAGSGIGGLTVTVSTP